MFGFRKYFFDNIKRYYGRKLTKNINRQKSDLSEKQKIHKNTDDTCTTMLVLTKIYSPWIVLFFAALTCPSGPLNK